MAFECCFFGTYRKSELAVSARRSSVWELMLRDRLASDDTRRLRAVLDNVARALSVAPVG